MSIEKLRCCSQVCPNRAAGGGSAGLLVMNSLSFFVSEKVFSLPFVLRCIFAGYKILS